MIEAYPLQWPMAYPRTNSPQKSKFITTMMQARAGLLHELKLLGAKDVIISSNVPVRTDGIPYANWERRIVKDHGVAVYFKHNGKSVVLCCDKWKSVEENMQAIYKSVEAIRGLDRWGVSDMLERVFTGFNALPAATIAWHEILGVAKESSPEAVKAAYRELARKYHPDTGTEANSDQFQRIQQAWEAFQNL